MGKEMKKIREKLFRSSEKATTQLSSAYLHFSVFESPA